MSYTMQQARQIMNETSRILANDAKRKQQMVTVRAHATPRTPSADDLFFDYVGEKMDEEGCSRADAIALVAKEKPHIHAAWIQAANKQRREEDARDRREAARARASRNR